FLGKLTLDGMFTESSLGLAKFFYITHLGIGPDGSLWYSTISGPDAFGSEAYNGFRRLNASGSSTFIPTGSLAPVKFTVGPAGNSWFLANGGAVANRLGRATMGGAVTQYETGGVTRFIDLTAGLDGKLWLIDSTRNVVTRLTLDSAGSAMVTRAASFVGGAVA